jgi:uncharacterized protein (DUF58 family)
MRLRKRAAGLGVGAAVVFLIGTNVQAGWLYVLAAMMLGALIAGMVLPVLSLRRLEAVLVAPREATQGDAATVDLRIENAGRRSSWSVVATDGHLAPTTLFIGSLAKGDRVEVTTRRAPRRRGLAGTTGVEVRSAAPFGVAERRRHLPVAATTLVLPRVFELEALGFAEPIATQEVGSHPWPRRGHGPDHLGAREYRLGDSMRHVHWPLTARHGTIMVREFEEERTHRLAVFVDTERDAGVAWTPLDRVCSTAASILEAAAAHGHGVRLAGATTSSGPELVARAGEDELMRWLARLEPSGWGFADVIEHLGPHAARGAETVVLVFPAWGSIDVERLASAIGALSGPRTVVCVAVGLTAEEGKSGDPIALEAGLGRVEFRWWDPAEELATALATRVHA